MIYKTSVEKDIIVSILAFYFSLPTLEFIARTTFKSTSLVLLEFELSDFLLQNAFFTSNFQRPFLLLKAKNSGK